MFLRTAVTVPTNASEHVVPERSPICGGSGPGVSVPVITAVRQSSATPAIGVSTNSGMLRRTLVDLWKREGVRGLYRGLLCELLKVVPTVGLTFLTFETIKRELEDRRL